MNDYSIFLRFYAIFVVMVSINEKGEVVFYSQIKSVDYRGNVGRLKTYYGGCGSLPISPVFVLSFYTLMRYVKLKYKISRFAFELVCLCYASKNGYLTLTMSEKLFGFMPSGVVKYMALLARLEFIEYGRVENVPSKGRHINAYKITAKGRAMIDDCIEYHNTYLIEF